MKRASSVLALWVLLLVTIPSGASRTALEAIAPGLMPEGCVSAGSVLFIENVGQFAEEVRFQVRGGGGTLWLTEGALWLSGLAGVEAETASPAEFLRVPDPPKAGVHVKLSFAGARSHPRLEPFGRMGTRVSYLRGGDPARWAADVPVWSGLRYVDIYPGIDLLLTGEGGRWHWRLETRGEADLSQVHLRVEGAQSLAAVAGSLRTATLIGELRLPLLGVDGPLETGPTVTHLEGEVFDVHAPFAAPSARASGVVQPGAGLLYSTFLGSSDQADEAWDIAVDGSGNAYVVGETWIGDFPATPGAYDPSHNGSYDVFVAKLNPQGNGIVYATFLGSDLYEYGRGIAVDSAGNAYVTGQATGPGFPVTSGAYDTTFNGGNTDVFVSKLNASGSSLVYSTYAGGGLDQLPVPSDYPFGIAVDASGRAYVAGSTESDGFPTTAGAWDRALDGSQDGFLFQLKADGSDLVYSTYIGGTSHEYCQAVAVDRSNQAYVTGRTYSTDYPTTPGAYDTSHNGEHDAYVSKFKADGSGLVYSTFIGGGDWEIGLDLEVDRNYSLYLSGSTESANFPTTEGAYDRGHNGLWDAFVLKLDADGRNLLYSTLFGGQYEDRASGIALDSYNNAHLVGDTISPNFPATGDAFDGRHNGSWDAFVARVNGDGSRLAYATYLGGGSWDEGHAIAVDSSNHAYAVGRADSSTFPVTSGAYDTAFGPFRDAFVSKWEGSLPDIAVLALEITQGTQNLENDIPLVEGRKTYARAYVYNAQTELGAIAGIDGQLRGYRDGAELPNSPDRAHNWATAGPTTGIDRANLDDGSLTFSVPSDWLSGTVTFTVEVNPSGYGQVEESNYANNYLTETVVLNQSDEICLIVVPVHLHDHGDRDNPALVYTTEEADFTDILLGLKRYHPISEINWWRHTDTLYPSQHGWPLINEEWNMSEPEGRSGVLSGLWFHNLFTDDPADDCHYLGMIHPDIDTTITGTLYAAGKGYVPGDEFWVKMVSTQDADTPWYIEGGQTLAHELAHNVGLDHAWCAHTEPDIDPTYPYTAPCSLAEVDANGYYGFDVYYNTWIVTKTVISNDPAAAAPHRGYPLMGYRHPQWVSPWEYCKLQDTAYGIQCDLWDFAVQSQAGMAVIDPPEAGQDAPELVALRNASAYLVAGGQVDVGAGTAKLNLVYRLDALPASGMEKASENLANRQALGVGSELPYTLVQLDGSEAVLDAHELYLPRADEGPGEQVYNYHEVVALVSGTVKVQVRQGASVLAERIASPNPPTVELIAPDGGEQLVPGDQVQWTGSDLDGDPLAFDVLYSPDDGLSWRMLAMGLVGESYPLPVETLPGSEQGRIKVVVNDGFHTVEDISAETFGVPGSPPLAIIAAPGNGSTHIASLSLLLEGIASDIEDGPLSSGYAWTSDLDGALGSGEELEVLLSPGEHQITLTVTDSEGMSGSDQISVLVEQDAWGVYLPVILDRHRQ